MHFIPIISTLIVAVIFTETRGAASLNVADDTQNSLSGETSGDSAVGVAEKRFGNYRFAFAKRDGFHEFSPRAFAFAKRTPLDLAADLPVSGEPVAAEKRFGDSRPMRFAFAKRGAGMRNFAFAKRRMGSMGFAFA